MYINGFNETILILIGVLGVTFLYGVYIGLKTIIFYDRPPVGLTLLFSIFVGPLAVTASIFPITFSTINLFHQDVFVYSFWKNEFLSGVLPLRISTYMLTFDLGIWALRMLLRRKHLGRLHRKNGVNFQDAGNYFRIKHLEVATAWLSSDLASISCIRLSFYLLSVAALWVCRAENVHSMIFSALTWTVFFIADDAKVILDYCDNFKCSPLKKHATKLMVFDAIIVFCASSVLVGANGWLVALPFFITLFTLSLINRILIYRLPRLIKKEGNLRKKETKEMVGA
jgi:hypothetical protein